MIDQIDIYMLHGSDADVPLKETLDALNDEVNAGRLKVIGCSNHSAAQIQQALDISQRKGYARFEVIEPAYSMVDRSIAPELLPCANARRSPH